MTAIPTLYERPICGKGERNVAKIADNFCWARFTLVVITQAEGGLLAIIDGQHRITAAALVGMETVPCQVVILPTYEQADALRPSTGPPPE